ncbi:MAG: site-specific integrase [Cupriavidus sp.]|nr:MAG: site-specific integrase [Cupriavidus sp.]
MGRLVDRLTALEVKRLDAVGMHPDGRGLYLQIHKGGSKSWIYRYTLNGRIRAMGLGPTHLVSLAQARAMAQDARLLKAQGLDPLEARAALKPKPAPTPSRTPEPAKGLAFRDAAAAYIRANSAAWDNAKHLAQWTATLETYAYPAFGDLPVAEIDTTLVLKALEPIWSIKSETASRLRGRIESVLDWATVRGHRQGENPARWKGHLDKILPAKSKVARVEHHAALPFKAVPQFMRDLAERPGVAARALAFTILTAARTGEVIGAQWSEIDFEARLWIRPATRMKARKDHRVPLCDAAMAILAAMRDAFLTGRRELLALYDKPIPNDIPLDGFIFGGMRRGKGLSNMSLLKVLKSMGRTDLTTHGFRSTFRDWAAETTNYPGEVVEMALAHTIAGKVEAAYRRGDLLDKRRELMRDWSAFCGSTMGANAQGDR